LLREGLDEGINFAFYILTEGNNSKFYIDNKVSLFVRERFRESSKGLIIMSKHPHPSDSSEQIEAQKEILSILNQTHNLNLKSSKLLFEDTLFQVDGIQ